MKELKHVTVEEWQAEGERLFGTDKKKWRFECVNCGHVQTYEDFVKAGIDEPVGKVYFSCIGRWTNGPGTIGDGKRPCNYTNGGLFKLGPVAVKTPDGEETWIFDFDRSQP